MYRVFDSCQYILNSNPLRTGFPKSETKSDQIMAELKKHVSECNKKGLEAAKIRGEMQAQLQRIEGFLEGLI